MACELGEKTEKKKEKKPTEKWKYKSPQSILKIKLFSFLDWKYLKKTWWKYFQIATSKVG